MKGHLNESRGKLCLVWLAMVAAAPVLAQPATPAENISDYGKRVVAFVNEKDIVSRQQLGEYLIDRCGVDKLDLLINRRIIERACRTRGIEVNAGEIESALADDMKGLNVDRQRFIHDVLKAYRKNLYEWKEDIIRPKLQLAKLCRDKVVITEDEINEAFDAAYGEKIACRIILWPKDREEEAKAEYSALRDSEDAFAVEAKRQARGTLASTGGTIPPIARGSLGQPDVEREAFTLRPGEVSKLMATPDGILLLKCDRRLPADTTVNRDKVRPELVNDVRNKKVFKELPSVFAALRQEARPEKNLPTPGSPEDTPASRAPSVAVATIYGSENITREDLGEFLIARYGVDKVELLVNKIILEAACQARGVTCSPEEVEAELQKDLQRLGVDRKVFRDSVLKEQRLTLFEWTEDVLKTKVVLGKLCRPRVSVTDEDLKMAYEAYYGEAIKARFILWPKGEEKSALLEYTKLRDQEEAFDRKARNQLSPTLAARRGDMGVGPIRRHTLGNEQLEKEAFELQPGEVSGLVGTPEGLVICKCDARIPAEGKVKLDEVRAALGKEVVERKVQAEMPRFFAELRAAAKPRLMLKDPNKPVDLASEVEPELKELNKIRGPVLKTKSN